jgi:hypothetical protein
VSTSLGSQTNARVSFHQTGAIASIAFGNREPLVDGNVIRVMARMRAVGADPKNKQLINFSWKTAKDLVRECERPGALNQALMELGATVCTVQVKLPFRTGVYSPWKLGLITRCRFVSSEPPMLGLPRQN